MKKETHVVILLVLIFCFWTACSSNEQRLIEAAKKGETEKIRALLDRDVKWLQETKRAARPCTGRSIIMTAPFWNSWSDRGANVNRQDNYGNTL